jgi:hypothetical protein
MSKPFCGQEIHASDPFLFKGFLTVHGVVFDVLVARTFQGRFPASTPPLSGAARRLVSPATCAPKKKDARQQDGCERPDFTSLISSNR